MAKLLLAPMEGLADYDLRSVLTRVGGFDAAVTEFVRVSGSLLPARTFLRACPELSHHSRTRAGTPVIVQLLGSDPSCMAENAARLAELAPTGIDLNFGCPARTVNRHGGGAMLLATPELLFQIVLAVRRAVPAALPVTAKMRLGVADHDTALDCAAALEAGGAASLVVHARTKADGYKPPAHWEWVARIRDVVRMPVAANGEVWSVSDHARCRSVSGADDVMLGRGAVADPFLARRIRAFAAGHALSTERTADWLELAPLLSDYWQAVQHRVEPRHAPGRLKQWLAHLRRTFVEAEALYQEVSRLERVDEVTRALKNGPASQSTRVGTRIFAEALLAPLGAEVRGLTGI